VKAPTSETEGEERTRRARNGHAVHLRELTQNDGKKARRTDLKAVMALRTLPLTSADNTSWRSHVHILSTCRYLADITAFRDASGVPYCWAKAFEIVKRGSRNDSSGLPKSLPCRSADSRFSITTCMSCSASTPGSRRGWSDEEVVRRWGRLFPPRNAAPQVVTASDEWVQQRLGDAKWIATARAAAEHELVHEMLEGTAGSHASAASSRPATNRSSSSVSLSCPAAPHCKRGVGTY
jgi:hypothetical protein